MTAQHCGEVSTVRRVMPPSTCAPTYDIEAMLRGTADGGFNADGNDGVTAPMPCMLLVPDLGAAEATSGDSHGR